VQQVVEDGVAVEDEPEQAGHHEAQSTDGERPEAHLGKNPSRDQVHHVLDDVDVQEPEPHPVAKHEPHYAYRDQHDSDDSRVDPCVRPVATPSSPTPSIRDPEEGPDHGWCEVRVGTRRGDNV
jgi:hypothetical protein